MMKNLIRRVRNKILGVPNVYIDNNKFVLKKYLPSNPTILEAGVYDGRDTAQFLALWPFSKIYGFEPIPELFQKVKERFKNKKNVLLFEEGLSNMSGIQSINISDGESRASSSLLEPVEHLTYHPNVYFNNKINIKVSTIDEWASVNNVEKVDLIWLDLQGMELEVLKKALIILKSAKCLFLEVSFVETYENVPLYEEVKLWLELNGFYCQYLEDEFSDMGNALFVKK